MSAVLGAIAGITVTADDIAKAVTAVEEVQRSALALAGVLPVLQMASQVIANQQAAGTEAPSAADQTMLTNAETAANKAAEDAIAAEKAAGG